MPKSTAQLRKELSAAITEHDRYVAEPGGGLLGTLRQLEAIKELARDLSATLDAQPSRQGKPFRVSFTHTTGSLAGRVYKQSHSDIYQAVAEMRTVISCGGRVVLTFRDDSGEYAGVTRYYLRHAGYEDIADNEYYSDDLDSLVI